jgi:hypothetical protein
MSETRAKDARVWEQDPFQWYVEGAECTRALLRVEGFSGVIYDPACGQGNIMKAAIAAGRTAMGTDLVRRAEGQDGDWWSGLVDFLEDEPFTVANIVCNPPFYRAKGTEAFIRRALGVAKCKVAIFTDVKFLSGKERASGLYAEHPPSRIWHLSPRPSCPPGEYLKAGNKAGGGTADYCWLVWDLLSPRRGTDTSWLTILPEDRA